MSLYSIAKKPSRQLEQGVFEVWKERGETLATLLLRFRSEESISSDIPITYAGRLDPMADGVVLLLYGEARFKKDSYLRAKKTYEMQILFGISTDSLDPLGLATDIHFAEISKEMIERVVKDAKNITTLPYPMYSSRPVNGKPLFSYAREGEEVEAPNKKVEIFSVELLEITQQDLSLLVEDVVRDIQKVEGDFRQQKAIESWKTISKKYPNQKIILATIRTAVSSGTYMRSLAKWVGERFGIPTLAYKIVRTKISL